MVFQALEIVLKIWKGFVIARQHDYSDCVTHVVIYVFTASASTHSEDRVYRVEVQI